MATANRSFSTLSVISPASIDAVRKVRACSLLGAAALACGRPGSAAGSID